MLPKRAPRLTRVTGYTSCPRRPERTRSGQLLSLRPHRGHPSPTCRTAAGATSSSGSSTPSSLPSLSIEASSCRMCSSTKTWQTGTAGRVRIILKPPSICSTVTPSCCRCGRRSTACSTLPRGVRVRIVSGLGSGGPRNAEEVAEKCLNETRLLTVLLPQLQRTEAELLMLGSAKTLKTPPSCSCAVRYRPDLVANTTLLAQRSVLGRSYDGLHLRLTEHFADHYNATAVVEQALHHDGDGGARPSSWRATTWTPR